MADKRHTHILSVDGDAEITIVAGRKDRFFRFMHWIIDTGILAKLSPPAVKAYLVIGRYSDFTKGTCVLSGKRICRESGISRSSLHRAINILIDHGLISRMSGTSITQDRATMPNRYRVYIDDPRDQEDTPCLTGRQGGPLERQGGLLEKLPPVSQGDNPSFLRELSLETTERETTTAAAALLESAGIKGKTQKSILALVGDNIEQLQVVLRNAEHLSSRGKLTSKLGYIRQGLVDQYDLLPEVAAQHLQAERTQRAQSGQQIEARQRKDEEQQIKAEAKHRRDLLAALPSERLKQLIAEVLPTLSPHIRRSAAANPQANLFVQVAILEKLKQEV